MTGQPTSTLRSDSRKLFIRCGYLSHVVAVICGIATPFVPIAFVPGAILMFASFFIFVTGICIQLWRELARWMRGDDGDHMRALHEFAPYLLYFSSAFTLGLGLILGNFIKESLVR